MKICPLFSRNSTFTFTLFDSSGKIIFKNRIDSKKIDLKTTISNGIYFYRIETENKIYNGKLIVE